MLLCSLLLCLERLELLLQLLFMSFLPYCSLLLCLLLQLLLMPLPCSLHRLLMLCLKLSLLLQVLLMLLL